MRSISIVIFIIVFFIPYHIQGQPDILEQYIQVGLENNIVLKQKNLDYEQSLEVIRQAKSYYWPNVSINARYSVADGGRTIDLPIGDLLNPVYSTLNQMTGTAMFPQIENEEINFLRKKEHETKVRLTQPLFNGEIFYNHKISRSMSKYHRASRDAYARNLVAEIKIAYFNYLKTKALLDVLQMSKNILEENLHVNKKLYKNHKVTYDHVLQSETKLAEWEEDHATAIENNEKARVWFNFLLNKDLESKIQADIQLDTLMPASNVDSLQSAAAQREELEQISAAAKASHLNKKLNQSAYWPELSLVLDYGFQGRHYQFQGDDDFYIASLVLQWPVFQGMRRKSKVNEAEIAHQRSKLEEEKVQKQINIEVTNTWYAVKAAHKKYLAKTQQVKSTKATWKIIDKQYRQGMVNQLTHTNALEKYRIALEEQVIAKFDFYIQKAALEKAAAQLNIDQNYANYEE